MALKIDSAGMFSSEEFMWTVWKAVLKLYGEYGASQTNLLLVRYYAKKELAIIRTTQTGIDMVRAALASITKIGDRQAAIHVINVSGTIKALHRKTMQ